MYLIFEIILQRNYDAIIQYRLTIVLYHHQKSLGGTAKVARPSLGQSGINTASSPNLSSSTVPNHGLSASTRKQSFGRNISSGLSTIYDTAETYRPAGAPEEGSSPMTMQKAGASGTRAISGDAVGNKNLDIGDSVDVPGGMHGIVKFIGEVRGKKGIFAGVELNKEWAARGKNDGDVEGFVVLLERHRDYAHGLLQCSVLHDYNTWRWHLSALQ